MPATQDRQIHTSRHPSTPLERLEERPTGLVLNAFPVEKDDGLPRAFGRLVRFQTTLD